MTDELSPDYEFEIIISPGASGFSGRSGYSGFSGKTGISGYSGREGSSGYSGLSGYSGGIGEIGISGYSGSGVSGYSGYSGQDLRDKERRSDYVVLAFSYSFCGTAPLGSLETDPVWKITMLEIDNSGLAHTYVFNNVAWSDRLMFIPG